MATIVDRDRARALVALLQRLFADENPTGADTYLTEHARPKAIKSHVNAFCWYAAHLPAAGAVLEWGCSHEPDSCLMRATFGDAFELFACDVDSAGRFPKFRAFSRADYQRTADVVRLPYADGHFDAVIGSGVLEHTATDYESLLELRRVLKRGGLLVISYYPYAYSVHEWWLRRSKTPGYHQRRATPRELDVLLKRAGLVPFEMRYQSTLPDLVDDSVRARVRGVVRKMLPPPLRSPVLCCLARKVDWM